jgi:hypothetical protein
MHRFAPLHWLPLSSEALKKSFRAMLVLVLRPRRTRTKRFWLALWVTAKPALVVTSDIQADDTVRRAGRAAIRLVIADYLA